VSGLWLAVVVAGAGSYLMRVLPFLLGERVELSPRTQDLLRHAGMGGITALLVLGVLGATTPGEPASLVPVLAALAVSCACALVGRSMGLTVAAGAAVYGVLALLVGT
jgi:branched-subunit amino acid transport protein